MVTNETQQYRVNFVGHETYSGAPRVRFLLYCAKSSKKDISE